MNHETSQKVTDGICIKNDGWILEKDFQVVGEAQDGRQAVAMVNQLRPDVALMDIAMPRLNGFEVARQILKTVPATKVLILSAHNDDAHITDATRSGAAGFLLKQNSAYVVGEAIRQVQNGKTFFGPVGCPAGNTP